MAPTATTLEFNAQYNTRHHAMANRPSRRAVALLLLPLLFIIALTRLGQYLHIFAAFDFLGAGGAAASTGNGFHPSGDERTQLRRKHERTGKHGNGASRSSKQTPAQKKPHDSEESARTSNAVKSKSEAMSPLPNEPSSARTESPGGVNTNDEVPRTPKLKLAWLMSFPNSGTSYTSKLIRTITNASTATNYGASTRDEYGCSRPIAPELESTGPFWQSNTYDYLGGGGKYLLTKTHCGGYCNGCGPSQYFETAQSFAEACSSGKKSTRCRRNGNGRDIRPEKADKDDKRFEVVRYDGTIMVKRAVHLLRNPFDNVVSRFHLKAKELDGRRHDGDSKSLHFDYNKDGFREWCKHIDATFVEEESELTAFSKRKELLKKIPCHADFIRFLLWHHYAERTQANLRLPTLVLHYEDYFSRFNETVSELMTFLDIPGMRNEPELFEIGKTYRDYFTLIEKRAVKELARQISTNETWGRIERYFSPY